MPKRASSCSRVGPAYARALDAARNCGARRRRARGAVDERGVVALAVRGARPVEKPKGSPASGAGLVPLRDGAAETMERPGGVTGLTPGVTVWTAETIAALPPGERQTMAALVDEAGALSARAQALPTAITSTVRRTTSSRPNEKKSTNQTRAFSSRDAFCLLRA